MFGAYGHPQPYRLMTTTEADPHYMETQTVPVSLPSMMHFSDVVKRGPGFLDEPSLSSTADMNCGFVPGLDVGAAGSYENSNPHVSYASQQPSTFLPHPSSP